MTEISLACRTGGLERVCILHERYSNDKYLPADLFTIGKSTLIALIKRSQQRHDRIIKYLPFILTKVKTRGIILSLSCSWSVS